MTNSNFDKNGEAISVGDYVRFEFCSTSAVGKVVQLYKPRTSQIVYCKICGYGGNVGMRIYFKRRVSFIEKLSEPEKTAFIIDHGEVHY